MCGGETAIRTLETLEILERDQKEALTQINKAAQLSDWMEKKI